MKTLQQHLIQAEDKGYAIGHVNFSTLEMLHGIFEAARSVELPVVVGVSEGERDFVGIAQARDLVLSLREEYDYPVFINADHCHSLESFKEAVDAGYDMAIIDKADEDLEENIRISRQAVLYAKEHRPDMLVEGEVGYIGQSSRLLDGVPEDAVVDGKGLVTPDIAEKYVSSTGVDLFAPAVGNMHGMLKGSANPSLNIKLIKEIKNRVHIPLVLHGGSGVTDDDFSASVEAGIDMIHISTEVRLAYRGALDQSLADNTEELAPYRYMKDARDAVSTKVSERLRLFGRK